MAVRSTWDDAQLGLPLEPPRQIYAVGELNAAIQRQFSAEFRGIRVSGEISDCRAAPSGHFYFVLKDSQSQIKCALFKGAARFVRFRPQDGLSVIARGSLEVYEARGEYQLIVDALEPQGAGALQLAFEQLKKKLQLEGLFDQDRKRPLPKYPWRIGLITSPAGAVVQDILHVLGRRFPGLHIRIYPVQVQGEGSAEQVCAGLTYFSRNEWPEVILLARGGGSLEDLWTFNEESVARAIAECKVPVVSAIGHETDFTISDFVADYRAPTPSAAAEVVVCTLEGLLQQVQAYRAKALQAIRYRLLMSARDLHLKGAERAHSLLQRDLGKRQQRVDELENELEGVGRRLLQGRSRQLLEATNRLLAADLRLALSKSGHRRATFETRLIEGMRSKIWGHKRRLETAQAHLRQLSPLAVLSRGYALVTKPQGDILRSSEDVAENDTLSVRLQRGRIEVRVEGRGKPDENLY